MGRPKKGEERERSLRPAWATRIVDARIATGNSQEWLAGKISQSQSAVSDYERGRSEPDIATFERLADKLGVSPIWLVFGAGAREPNNSDSALVALAEREKGNRHFTHALLATARMLAEEGLDADPIFLVRLATKITGQAQGAPDHLEARERIDRAVEIERREFREGLEALTKNRL